MIAIPSSGLLFAAALALAGCADVKDSSGPPPGGSFQGTAARPLQTESQRIEQSTAPVTRATPQPRSSY